MEVNLKFEELSGYIARHFGQRVEFQRDGDRAFRAVYHKSIFSKSVCFQVAAIEDNCLTIAFEGGKIVTMLISSFRSAINEHLGNGLILYKDNYLIVDLRVIPQAQALAAAIDIREVVPSDAAVIIRADLK